MTEPGSDRSPDDKRALEVAIAWLSARHRPSSDHGIVARTFGAADADDTLAAGLSAAGLGGWADAVQREIDERTYSLDVKEPVRWLSAQLALAVCMKPDHPRLFDLVDDLLALSGDDDEAFAKGLVDRIGHGSVPHLLKALCTRLESLANSRLYERVGRLAQAQPGRPVTTRDLWPGPNDVLIGDGWAHRAASRLWPDRYAEMLCAFPVPFQHAAMDRLSPASVDHACALVAASPAHYSIAGTALGPALLFALIERYEADLVARAATDPDRAASDLRQFIDAILARADGQWIARAWLQQQIWRGRVRRAGRSQGAMEASKNLGDMLIAALSEGLAPLGEKLVDWVQSEEPLWRVHRILAEASIVEVHAGSVEASDILALFLLRGDVTATGCAEGLVSGMPEAKIVGRVLGHHPAPQTWFGDLWTATYEQREKLRFLAHINHESPAYPALAWGIQALNSSGRQQVDMTSFWTTLASAALETQMTDPMASLVTGAMGPICRVLIQIGGALVAAKQLPIENLAAFLGDQIAPTAENALLWNAMRLSGSRAVMNEVAQHIGPLKVARALEAGLSADASRGWNRLLDDQTRKELRTFVASLAT